MLLQSFIRAAVCALGISTAQAFTGSSGTEVSVRSSPEMSSAEVMRLIGRSLSEVSHQKRETLFQNSSSFEKSWDGAVLLSLSYTTTKQVSGSQTVEVANAIEITCTTCYIKAGVLAELTIAGPFNISETFNNFTDQVGAAVENTTDTTINYIKNYTTGVITKFDDGIDLDDFDLPPLDIDFNIDIPEIPECQLRFQFDELEMYVALNTVFSSGITYTLNLYTSQTPFGVMISEDLFFGVVVAVDLILSAEAEISISSGFHIKVDDGAELKLALFGEEIAETDFKGGLFEFLPVTIESAGVVLKAVLRVQVRAGFEISTPEVNIGIFDVGEFLSASAGVEVSVWTHLAELTTNVTITPAGDEEDECQLRVEEHYQFGIGAAAGATVALAAHTWGPAPSTTIPVFFTSFTQCAIQSSAPSTVTSSATIAPRQASGTSASLTTTTISTEVTYRGIECMSSQIVDCPVSLQRTTKTVTEITLVTSVPSGVEATFPATIRTTSVQPIEFGTAVNKLFETAGPPTPYTPEQKQPSGGGFLDGEIGGVDKRIIFGVSLGGGILVLGAIIGGVIFCYRRKKYSAVPPPPRDQITTYQSGGSKSGLYDPGRTTVYTTTEIRRSSR